MANVDSDDDVKENKPHDLLPDNIKDLETLKKKYTSYKKKLKAEVEAVQERAAYSKVRMFMNGFWSGACATIAAVDIFVASGTLNLVFGGIFSGMAVLDASLAKDEYKKLKTNRNLEKEYTEQLGKLDEEYARKKEAILNPPPPSPPDAMLKIIGAGHSFDQSAQKPDVAPVVRQDKKPEPPAL